MFMFDNKQFSNKYSPRAMRLHTGEDMWPTGFFQFFQYY